MLVYSFDARPLQSHCLNLLFQRSSLLDTLVKLGDVLDLHPRIARWARQEFEDNSRRRPLAQDDLLNASQMEYMTARVHQHGRFLLNRGREANAAVVIFFY